MITVLKKGISDEKSREASKQVQEIVEGILQGITDQGDAHVRELSEKFDNWSPTSFRLSDEEIQACIDSLPENTLRDIKFAQEQVKNFARIQLDSMKNVEVETRPGVILGHKHLPMNSVGCYIPGGKYPLVASAHMSVATAKVAGVKRVIACAPPFNGKPMPAIVSTMALA
jgi:sulfopropanediol 3-dehydrogenase